MLLLQQFNLREGKGEEENRVSCTVPFDYSDSGSSPGSLNLLFKMTDVYVLSHGI